jgi:hypothetical protein
MEKLQEFQAAAHQHGFVDVEETEDATVLWLRKPTPTAEDRMCIDTQANTATVFWATIPWKINSKTFRAASALQEWFLATREHGAIRTTRDALLRLATDRNDAAAMDSLRQSNAEVIRTAIGGHFATGTLSEKAELIVMERVALRARSYESADDPEQWFAQCVHAECDRLRNEGIQEKANRD